MIQFFHVYKTYPGDIAALVDLTLDINKGELVFLTGRSGAGKTTLLRMIFAAESPTRGQVLVDGRNVGRLKSHEVPLLRRNVGVVFQDFKLLQHRTVEENVSIALEVAGAHEREVRRKTYAILKDVGLAHKLHQYPQALSGGEQQRVAIARALVGDPQVLLADEPTGNLDEERSAEILALLQHANARGTTMIVATHDKKLLSLAQRVVNLDAGRVTTS